VAPLVSCYSRSISSALKTSPNRVGVGVDVVVRAGEQKADRAVRSRVHDQRAAIATLREHPTIGGFDSDLTIEPRHAPGIGMSQGHQRAE
jgi:hypothetical protein